MNLIADIGNSTTKIALFKGNHLVSLKRDTNLTGELINSLIGDKKIDAIIISSVSAGDDYIKELFSAYKAPLLILNKSLPLPFDIGYSTPESLGSDRIAGIAGAHNKFAGKNVLVIDAGTAITYDMLLSNNIYPGGNISPGLNTRFKSLNQFTGRLPLIEVGSMISDIGSTTESAIRNGVQMGLIFEINEYIRSFKNRYNDLEIVLTGGDSKFLKDYIDFSVTFAPELIMEGLNHILNYNVKVL
jgi:type III pantothenate kinase